MSAKRARIIQDTPAKSDAFSGAGHKRSAQALADAVDEIAGRDGAIGLEGSWGAGKSSVIEMATDKFAGDKKSLPFCVFTFDLWLHQTSLLKLAFFEEFLAWARRQGFLDEDQEKDFLARLADKRIRSKVRSRRAFGWAGIGYILLLPLLPLIYAWLSPFAFSGKGITTLQFPLLNWSTDPAFVASVLLFVPYAIFLAAFVGSKIKNEGANWLTAISSAARVFTRDSDFDDVEQLVRERNPTNEEFQSHFRELVSVVQSNKRRMIFVFDNIDRLSLDAVPLVWSEMRSIYAMKSRGRKFPNSDILAIVPFDRQYIKEAFPDGASEDLSRVDRVEQLLKKTFDITLRVAPPVNTDWKAFLDRTIEVVFPDPLPAPDKYELFKLFDIQKQQSGFSPTPREIIAYVNAVGMVWNQWQDQMPISHMAIYVLQKSHISPKSIKTGGLMSARFGHVIRDKEFPRSLAALHFNVEPSHAYQVLLSPEIREVAIGDSPEAFLETAKSAGFQEVFPDVVEESVNDWMQEDASLSANLVRNLSQEELKGDYLREVWLYIAGAFDRLDACDVDDPQAYVDLAGVLSKLSSEEAGQRATQLIDWYSRALPKEEERTIANGRNWMIFFSSVYGGLLRDEDDLIAKPFQRRTNVPKGPAFQVGLAAQAALTDNIDSSKFRSLHTPTEMEGPVLALAKSDPNTLRDLFVRKPWFISPELALGLTNEICERLANQKMDKPNRAACVETLCRLRSEHDDGRKLVPSLLQRGNDGTLVGHATVALGDDDKLTLARLAWLIMDASEGKSVPERPGNHPQFGDPGAYYPVYEQALGKLTSSDEQVGEIARLAARSKSFTRWMEFAIDSQRPTIFKLAFRRLVKDEDYRVIHVSQVVGAFDRLVEIFEEDELNAFVAKLSGWSQFFEKHFSGKNCTGIPASLIALISRGEAPSLSKLVEIVDAQLTQLESADWTAVFGGDEGALLDLLLVRIRSGVFRPTVEPFQSELREFTLSILEGEANPPVDAKLWNEVYQGLKPEMVRILARDLLVKLKDSVTTNEGVESFLTSCSDIADLMPLTDYPDVALEQLVFRAIMNPTQASSAFIENRAADIAKAVELAKPETQSSIREALETLRDSGEEASSRATAWALRWRLKLAPSQPPPSTADS